VTYRSDTWWPLTEDGELAAHQWYLEKRQKLHRIPVVDRAAMVRTYPIFPPLVGEENTPF
jgi:hypothetical protein